MSWKSEPGMTTRIQSSSVIVHFNIISTQAGHLWDRSSLDLHKSVLMLCLFRIFDISERFSDPSDRTDFWYWCAPWRIYFQHLLAALWFFPYEIELNRGVFRTGSKLIISRLWLWVQTPKLCFTWTYVIFI